MRGGYRERALDTRLGTLNLKVPKLRQDSYFPGSLSTLGKWLRQFSDDPSTATQRGQKLLAQRAATTEVPRAENTGSRPGRNGDRLSYSVVRLRCFMGASEIARPQRETCEPRQIKAVEIRLFMKQNQIFIFFPAELLW